MTLIFFFLFFSSNHIDEILALLSGFKLSEACEKAQANGDHYAALMISTSSGFNSMNGQMILQQLDRWQEMRADKFIQGNRLRLFTLLAGESLSSIVVQALTLRAWD